MKKAGFVTGMISGAIVGSMVTMAMDPIKDKQNKAIKKNTTKAFRTLGSVIDTIIDAK